MEEQLELTAKKIIIAMYLTLLNYGYSKVSLKKEDLQEYIPKLEILLKRYHLFLGNLFVKTRISESYDEYTNFLIRELFGNHLGYFNYKYDAIILECSKFDIDKCQKELIDYKEIIQEGCYLISNNICFISDDSEIELSKISESNHKKKIIRK